MQNMLLISHVVNYIFAKQPQRILREYFILIIIGYTQPQYLIPYDSGAVPGAVTGEQYPVGTVFANDLFHDLIGDISACKSRIEVDLTAAARKQVKHLLMRVVAAEMGKNDFKVRVFAQHVQHPCYGAVDKCGGNNIEPCVENNGEITFFYLIIEKVEPVLIDHKSLIIWVKLDAVKSEGDNAVEFTADIISIGVNGTEADESAVVIGSAPVIENELLRWFGSDGQQHTFIHAPEIEHSDGILDETVSQGWDIGTFLKGFHGTFSDLGVKAMDMKINKQEKGPPEKNIRIIL